MHDRAVPEEEHARSVTLRALATRLWTDWRFFLPTLALVQLWFCRGVFERGALADIDSICHVSYLEYLVKEFHPATGTFFGYTPRYNLGAPFLLYNIPPGTHIAGFVLAKLGFSAVNAIKALLVVSFLAISPLAYVFARAGAKEGSSLPQCVAIAIGLYSSELFGLEFFFHNGMVNACLAVPLLLGAMAGLRWAYAAEPEGRGLGLRALCVATAFFAAVVLTHLLSMYFTVLAFLALLLGEGPRRFGRNAVAAGLVLAGGFALAAFWLVPSLAFVPHEEPVISWIRPPIDTLESLADGSLLSSFFGGFSPSYKAISNVGIGASIAGAIGIVEAFRTRDRAFRGVAIFALLCLAISLGPGWTMGIGWLPHYPRLLWYRFITPFTLAWLLLAGYGAWRALALRWHGRVVAELPLGIAIAFALVTLEGRAQRVTTTTSFDAFLHDYEEVTSWMNEHGDRRGRVFGEFLALTGREPPSVNYLRQMLAIDTGFDEVGGWIYENSPASGRIIARGEFWWAPSLLADDADRLDLKYVVAGTLQLRRAFTADARWTRVVHNETFDLFEAKGDLGTRLATAEGRTVTQEAAAYEKGGGYTYRFRVGPGTSPLVVRVNAGKAWSARAGDRALAVGATDDQFVSIAVPAEESVVELRFSDDVGRARGRWLSLAALAIVVALATGAGRAAIARFGSPSWVEIGGRVGFAAALLVVFVLGMKNDLTNIHWGPPYGYETQHDPHAADLGTIRERQEGGLVRAIDGAWEAAAFDARDRDAERTPTSAPWHAHLRLGPGASIRVIGDAPEVTLTLGSGSTEHCVLHGASGAPIAVPEDCRLRGLDEGGPGRALDLRIAPLAPVRHIAIDDRTQILQAESFYNDRANAGDEGSGWPSDPYAAVQNGLTIVGVSGHGVPLRMHADHDFAPGDYEAWLLVATVTPAFAKYRAVFALSADGHEIGSADAVAKDILAPILDEPLKTPIAPFRWYKVGTAHLGPRSHLTLTWVRKAETQRAFGEIDALAFVPVAPSEGVR